MGDIDEGVHVHVHKHTYTENTRQIGQKAWGWFEVCSTGLNTNEQDIGFLYALVCCRRGGCHWGGLGGVLKDHTVRAR